MLRSAASRAMWLGRMASWPPRRSTSELAVDRPLLLYDPEIELWKVGWGNPPGTGAIFNSKVQVPG
jgi:hypothetical protein